jgi:hypothetical protein
MTRQEKLILGTDYIIQGLNSLQEATTGDYIHEESRELAQVLSQMEPVLFNMKRCWNDWAEFVECARVREVVKGKGTGGRG